MDAIIHAASATIQPTKGRATDVVGTRRLLAIAREENFVPWSILRATQFQALMETFLEVFAKPPFLVAVPFKWQSHPVGPSEVAGRLAEAVTKEPAGRLPDFGGPEARTFKSIAESWLKRAN
jgi:hypothetical protein